MLNPMLAALANNPLTGQALALLERLAPGGDQRLRVITYHRIADPAMTPLVYPNITVHPQLFEQHMRFLSQRYHVVSMEEVLLAARATRRFLFKRPTRVNFEPHPPAPQAEKTLPAEFEPQWPEWIIPNTGSPFTTRPSEAHSPAAPARLPRRAVLLTFDDATSDFVENALPILRRYHLPATLFVPTAFPGSPERAFWWDRLYAAVEQAHNLNIIQTPLGGLMVETAGQRRGAFRLLRTYVKSLPHQAAMEWIDRFCAELEAQRLPGSVLTWDALRALRAEGITLGAHTRSHPMLERISPDEVRAEAVGSWQDLRRETGETLPVFAYPSGGFNSQVVEILRQEGFELAFNTQRGTNHLTKTDPLLLKRINAGPNTSLNLLRAQLLAA